jgi:ATP-binding cassette subfamily C (CFTR/MRP) protein 1
MAAPLIILHTVNFVESFSTPDPELVAVGFGLVGAAFLSYLVYALAVGVAHVAVQRCSLALRGALMEALYRKSLVMKVETAREMGAARVSNLMSVDVKSIITQVESLNEVWTAILMTGVGLYIIWTQIGLSFVS